MPGLLLCSCGVFACVVNFVLRLGGCAGCVRGGWARRCVGMWCFGWCAFVRVWREMCVGVVAALRGGGIV